MSSLQTAGVSFCLSFVFWFSLCLRITMPKFRVFLRKFGDACGKVLFFLGVYADDSARRLFPAVVFQNSATRGVRQSYLLYFLRGYRPRFIGFFLRSSAAFASSAV